MIKMKVLENENEVKYYSKILSFEKLFPELLNLHRLDEDKINLESKQEVMRSRSFLIKLNEYFLGRKKKGIAPPGFRERILQIARDSLEGRIDEEVLSKFSEVFSPPKK